MAGDDDVLAILRAFARGDLKTAGRDEVGAGPVVVSGGVGDSRTLVVDVVGDAEAAGERRLIVRAGGRDVTFTFTHRGEFIFAHGDLRVAVADRAGGAAFVDEVGRWLGLTLAAAGTAPDGAPELAGHYVRLGERRDADAVDWELFKLFFDVGEAHAEVFFRVAAGAGRAAFAEKWSEYRAPLLRIFDDGLGAGRALEPGRTVDVLGGGGRFTAPTGWLVTEVEGHVRATDPDDECCFEISRLPAPAMLGGPSSADLLAQSLTPSQRAVGSPMTHDRGDLELTWIDYDYDSDDPHRGNQRRAARGRTLLARNDRGYLFATFVYWVDDAPWAVPCWDRIIASVEPAP